MHHSPLPAARHASLLVPAAPAVPLAKPRGRCIHEPLLFSRGRGRDISPPAVPAAGLEALAPPGAGAAGASPPPVVENDKKKKGGTKRLRDADVGSLLFVCLSMVEKEKKKKGRYKVVGCRCRNTVVLLLLFVCRSFVRCSHVSWSSKW